MKKMYSQPEIEIRKYAVSSNGVTTSNPSANEKNDLNRDDGNGDYFSVPVSVMLSKTRKGNVVAARHISMFLSRKHTHESLAVIGSKCGNKDHATVLHACKSVKNSYETDRRFRIDLDEIEKRITE